jgi:FdhD protein
MNSRNPLTNPVRYSAGKWETMEAGVIAEMPVNLTVNGQVWLTFLCTPTELEALAVGFLFNEGVIKSKEQIELVKVCSSGDNVDVWLKSIVEQPQQWWRTTGCNGASTSVALDQVHPELKYGLLLTPQMVRALIKTLAEAQVLYREVGGIHTSILSDGERLVVSAEDIGGYNSLDKIAGRCLLENIELVPKILVTTGRISSDMIQKAARIGAAVVISRISASSLSVSLADKWGITLIGYARHDQFIVYTHPERIKQQTIGIASQSRLRRSDSKR